MRYFSDNSGVIHFVGIGGIGMSGIADILVNLGYKVTGSDLKENAMTARLARKGVKVMIGHEPENVRGAQVVVVSSAISKDNPEVLAARRLKIPLIKRAEMLAELMKMKMSVAVAGTHGKTTTTSMIAAVLEQARLDPTVINGGIINAYNNNARLGAGDWIVVEADESDGSFTKLNSTIAVVTNMDFDHIDNFEDFDDMRAAFVQFIENVPFYGAAILCIDHPEVAKIAAGTLDRKIITYGLKPSADVSCEDAALSKNGIEFSAVFSPEISQKYNLPRKWERITLNMFGEHNVQNALAAVCAALQLHISEENVRVALGSFMGVKRRFTKIAEINGVTIIDDYAHHPVEIEAVLKAARTVCPGRVFAVMQPHRYTRLHNFLFDFAKVLELSDQVFVTPIYSAGEQSNGTDHFSLLKVLTENGAVPADFAQDVHTLYTKIFDKVQKGDYIVFLGAGDITRWASELSEVMQAESTDGADRKTF